MTGLRIDPLGAADAAAAGRLLAASHRDYPAFRVEFPDPGVRNRVLIPFQTAAARDAAVHGSLVGAFLDDRLAGVALWQPPGRFPLTPLRKACMTPALLRAAIAAPVHSGSSRDRALPSSRRSPTSRSGTCRPSASIPTPNAAASARHCSAPGSRVVDADHAACHLHIGPGERRVLPAVGIQAHPTCVPGRGRRADVLRDDPPGVDVQRMAAVCHLGLAVGSLRGAEQARSSPVRGDWRALVSPGGQAFAQAPQRTAAGIPPSSASSVRCDVLDRPQS